MKTLIIILLTMLPFTLMAKNYRYNRVAVKQTGSDNFSMDKVQVRNTGGNISLNGTYLSVDGERYKLKPWKKDNKNNIYKAHGYLFKLIYDNGGALSYVQQFQYDKTFVYYVQPEPAMVATTTPTTAH